MGEDQVKQFIIDHHTAILLALGWTYSAVMSSMPEVDPKTLSFPRRWLLQFAQFIAANTHKV